MNILSLDLEYNQPTQTIIQVGYVIGDIHTGHIHESVCREVYTEEEISPYIVQLTGVTQDMVDDGYELLDVYHEMVDKFKDYNCFRNCLTWGGGDSQDLREALHLDDVQYLFGRRWIDAKTLFVSRCIARGEKHQAGLAKAMTRMGLRFDGRKHNACDDAFNTFRIYRQLLEELPNSKVERLNESK